MQDRVVNTNPRRYELVPVAGTGTHGGSLSDVYIGYTPDVVGTPLKESVLFDDALCNSYGLNVAQTDYTQTDFPSPSNAFRDVWKFVYPVGTIFESTTLATANAVSAWFGGGTWAAWGAGKFSVAYSSGDTDFGTVEQTGGNKGLQKHTHAVNHGHTTATSGTLTSGANTDGLGTDTIANHTHTTPNHTHVISTQADHNHSTPNHIHTTGTESQSHLHGYAHGHSTDTEASHDHNIYYKTYTLQYDAGGSTVRSLATSGESTANSDFMKSNGSHQHSTDSQDDLLTDAADRTHTHSVSSSGGGTSGSDGGHSHTTTAANGGATGGAGSHTHTIAAHTHTIAGHTHTIASASFTSSENTQTGGAVAGATNGNLPPFIVCYRYLRTA